MTDTTETGVATAAPEVKTETAPVEQQSTDTAPAAATAEQADKPEEAAAPETDTGEDSAEEDKPKKKGGGFQNRIDKITREKYEAELKAQKLQQENEQLRQQVKPAEIGEEPRLDSGKFADVESWQKAHREWAEKEGEKKGYEKARQETIQQQQEREALSVRAAVAAREAIARQKYPDFDASVMPLGQILMSHPAISQYVATEPMGAEMAYHLTKNPVILDEIRKMPTYQAGRELLKLEAKLSASPPPKTITKAPDPIKPVGANEKVAKSLEDMPMEEYHRRRREERLKHKG